ncbi:hypothetical protein MTR67_025910 [Solanum verrucosum]|uniref:Integrase zinc-binding domain-containing protein n=1 Tax=Solanum verrucosum TaxID=315347 RepID=A0AAF0R189_SOLVR|nr:hypothetical protein MTR67_025910 [Solanum verrucosum]
MKEVKEKQDSDPIFLQLKGAVHQHRVEVFSQGGDGVLRYQGRLCVLKVGDLKQKILTEAHNSRYFIHPGSTKMYRDLREVFWWNGMKRDIANFVVNVLTVNGLRHHDSIWVIMDRVTKSAHFLAVKTTDSPEDYAKLYISEIVRVGNVAYELEFPAELEAVHPVFHIFLLKKCMGDPTSIVPLESVAVKDSLTYEEVPVEILDHQVRRLRNKEVASVKVLWRGHTVEGATLEAEAAMKAKYPHLFPSNYISASGNSSSLVS